MNFTYEDQLNYTKIAIALFELEKTETTSLQTIIDFGELINKHSGKYNGLVYDVVEYIYEQQRLLLKEDGAYDDIELREQLDTAIKESATQSKPS